MSFARDVFGFFAALLPDCVTSSPRRWWWRIFGNVTEACARVKLWGPLPIPFPAVVHATVGKLLAGLSKRLPLVVDERLARPRCGGDFGTVRHFDKLRAGRAIHRAVWLSDGVTG